LAQGFDNGRMLRVQIAKRADGGGVLRCVRTDGSVTWQKQSRHAAFFAAHDLTHFAVESTLGLRAGFFGLIAAGWDIEDTTGQGLRGPLPEEALEVERIVGLLDAERGSRAIMTAEEFNNFRGPGVRGLSEDELRRVRARRAELFAQWAALPAGETLELVIGG
ncbi:MAG TPA: hypothetical protein VGV35_10755, partial [Bryobacteraceae bacterium]|nr:hypothetical protein [Bryobacteraceae bacterium]